MLSNSIVKARFARLCEVGVALSNESHLHKLLKMIVREARALTHAEGAALYLRQGSRLGCAAEENEVLQKRKPGYERFFHVRPLPANRSSLCGQAALSGRTLNVSDAGRLRADAGGMWRQFDQLNGYRTRSLLTIPLQDPEGENIGVLQLMNARSTRGTAVPFDKAFEQIIGSLASQAAVAVKNARLTTELHRAYQETLCHLSVAAEYRDDATASHVKRMGAYAALIAEHYGLPPERVDSIRIAGPMHDIGKIGIPDAILLKPGPLTPEEFEIIKKHPEIGARILGDSKTGILKLAKTIAYTHHEKYDGTGYPHGLRGRAIPLEGRIVAIADVFDALTTRRCYKPAMTAEFTVEAIAGESGKHFDPDCVQAFLKARDRILKIHQELNEAYEPPGALTEKP